MRGRPFPDVRCLAAAALVRPPQASEVDPDAVVVDPAGGVPVLGAARCASAHPQRPRPAIARRDRPGAGPFVPCDSDLPGRCVGCERRRRVRRSATGPARCPAARPMAGDGTPRHALGPSRPRPPVMVVPRRDGRLRPGEAGASTPQRDGSPRPRAARTGPSRVDVRDAARCPRRDWTCGLGETARPDGRRRTMPRRRCRPLDAFGPTSPPSDSAGRVRDEPATVIEPVRVGGPAPAGRTTAHASGATATAEPQIPSHRRMTAARDGPSGTRRASWRMSEGLQSAVPPSVHRPVRRRSEDRRPSDGPIRRRNRPTPVRNRLGDVDPLPAGAILRRIGMTAGTSHVRVMP